MNTVCRCPPTVSATGKTIQEVISLTVFGVFSTLYLGESLTWNHLIGFGLIVAGAFFVFKG